MSTCQTHCVISTLSRRLFIILYGLLLAKPFELSIKRRCRQNGCDPYDNQDRHGDSQANRRAPAIRLATRQRCAQMGVKPLWDAWHPADKRRHFELQQIRNSYDIFIVILTRIRLKVLKLINNKLTLFFGEDS